MMQEQLYGNMTYLDEDAELIRSLLAPSVAVPEGSHALFVLYAVPPLPPGQWSGHRSPGLTA